MNRKRVSLVLLLLSAALVGVVGVLNAQEVLRYEAGGPYQRYEEAVPHQTKVAEPRPNPTVITGYAKDDGRLIATHPNGTLWYYSTAHDEYYDVDPVPSERATVIVSAMDEYTRKQCPADHTCSRESILRVNLSTGTEDVLYQRYRPYVSENEWHDVDRIGDSKFLVAGMEKERVFVVNTSTGIIDWAWDPQSHYSIATGGSNVFGTGAYPRDWTHLNDVTLLDDGRIMVSMRNHDEVIFLNRSTGVVENWTIGDNNDYSVLFEQHNPDYIPRERGGPAVVVADSQNNRIVEFQRVDGEWKQSWTWKDDGLKWPRDADRLPNGNTLITDTNGHRVLEVGTDGSVVWSMGPLPGVYDVERLGTGDESTGGESATRLGLPSTRAPHASPSDYQRNILLNALRFVTPWWFDLIDGVGLLAAAALAFGAAALQADRVLAALRRLRSEVCRRVCER